MARARHEPHSGGSPCLGNPVKQPDLKPLLCDLPTPREKVKEHTNMSGRRSARLKAASAKAPPAAKPPPKRTAKTKPPKSKEAPKRSKTGHTPSSGANPIPTVGAMPAADAPPSPAQNEDLGDDPNAEAQHQPPPQPTAPPSEDEQSQLPLVHVVDVDRGVEIGIRVDAETAQWFRARCPEAVITLADGGHMIIARLATSLAFAASSALR